MPNFPPSHALKYNSTEDQSCTHASQSIHKYFLYPGKYFGKKPLDTWLFNHSFSPTLYPGTSMSHSAFFISFTFVDRIFFCSSDNPASSIHISISLLSENFKIESTNSFNKLK